MLKINMNAWSSEIFKDKYNEVILNNNNSVFLKESPINL